MNYLINLLLKSKLAMCAIAALLCFAGGYFFHSYRVSNQIANYDKREQERMTQIAVNDAEQNKLRRENNVLREHVAKLSAEDEALKAIIESRGGAIAVEAKNLEKLNEELKHDQAVINAPTDKCVRCRRFSERAVAAGQIARPLTCKDECAGVN